MPESFSFIVNTFREYEPWLIDCVPPEGEVALDVGANVGRWTRVLAEGYRIVHAFEPNPEALPALKANLPANVIIHGLGLWSERKRVVFNAFGESGYYSAYFEKEDFGKGTPALSKAEREVFPLDALGISGKVDFIKIDTEGAEVHIIQGAERLIRANRPALLIEVHSHPNLELLKALLASFGYTFRLVFHPFYPKDSPYRSEHLWLVTL